MGPSVKTEPPNELVVVPKLDSAQLSLTLDLTKEPEDVLGCNFYDFLIDIFILF